MKRQSRNPRSTRGETLAETLVAILIISLASVALASMISASSRMNITARENDNRLYTAIGQLETDSGESEDGVVTVTINGQESRKVNFSVSIATGGDGLLSSFDYAGGGT